MFDPGAAPRLFGLAPGVDFPAAFVAGLVRRMAGRPPEDIARVTVYLNTARIRDAVRAAFDGYGAGFLPRLRLVTDIGRDPLAGLPPAVPKLRRRLELARLVGALVRQMPGLAGGTAAFDLAESLAALMDEMQGEGVSPERLERPGLAENHATHWEQSLAFIRIIARYGGGDPDPEARQRQVTEALVAGWAKAPPADPVIIAGSTGSRGTTQLLMQAAAGLPQGAVVLPGFDFDMTEGAWTSLSAGPVPLEDHPQYRFLRLAGLLGTSPGAVRIWSDTAPAAPGRNRLVSLALRPAPVTDQWMAEGAALGPLGQAASGMALIEAPSPRAEALAIALRLRAAAEMGTRAALITPDRTLARRVTAALDLWGIVPDDSAGQPLVQSPPGRFLRHVAVLLGEKLSAGHLLELLKHPLTATGAGDRGNHLRFTRDLELVLRRKGPPFPEGADLIAWAKAEGDAERLVWAEWLAHHLGAPVLQGPRPLAERVAAHLGVAGALAAGPGGTEAESQLWRAEAGGLAQGVMAELLAEADAGADMSPGEYAALVTSLLSSGNVRQSAAAHPAVAIRGTLEARIGGADLVILGGLNEGVWPEMPAPDPWLSRQMRQKVGLLSPERQIGLAAHDFQQAVAAPEVVLTRAVRDAEAETVASRWLARLTNLLAGLPEGGGREALGRMRSEGRRWLAMAAALEAPGLRLPPAVRPAPRPPVARRPRQLAVTGIRELIRDPYSIYARHVLGLRALDPLHGTPDARLRGQVLHLVAEHFLKERPPEETEAEARQRLIALAERVLDAEVAWPAARRLWRARLLRFAGAFVAAEAGRALSGTPVVVEKKGAVRLDAADFTLTARPDRIDLCTDGRVHIYDYKSGAAPTDKQQQAFDKQLILEAAMAERGGFPALGPGTVEVEGASYIRLGGEGEVRPAPVSAEAIARTWAELQRLIAAYDRRETGYIARRAVFEARMDGDYDHLARFGEWDMTDPATPEEVG